MCVCWERQVVTAVLAPGDMSVFGNQTTAGMREGEGGGEGGTVMMCGTCLSVQWSKGP